MLKLLITGIAALGLLYLAYRFVSALVAPTAKPPAPSPRSTGFENDARRQAAIEQLKSVHAAARDQRRQVAKMVEEDPNRAAKAVKVMMKGK